MNLTKWYTVRTLVGYGFRVTEFDFLFNVEKQRLVKGDVGSRMSCTCETSDKFTCRHRQMVLEFFTLNRLDRGYFINWDEKQWSAPISDTRNRIRRRLGERR